MTVLMAAGLLVVLAAGWWRWQQHRSGGGRPDLSAPTAWTPRRHLPIRPPGGLSTVLGIGLDGDRVIAADATTPLMVIGATGSAKTSAVVIPQILEWDGPLLSTSVKTDVLTATAGWRAQQGQVAVFDPAGSLPADLAHLSRPWTPMAAARTWPDAARTAHALVAAAVEAPGGERFWTQQAQLLLSGLLYLVAAHPEGTMRQVVERLAELTDARGFARLSADIDHLATAGHPQADLAALAVAPLAAYPPNTAGSVVATVQAALAVYLHGAATDVLADDPDLIRSDLLLARGGSLYLVGPPREQTLYRPLYTALVAQVIADAYAAAAGRPGGILPRRLLLSLDEVANVAPLPELPTIASTCRSTGIQLVTVVQDLAQLDAAYGAADAASILSNHVSVALLPRIKDLTTLTWAETVMGDTEVTRTSTATARTSGRQDGERARSSSRGTTRTTTTAIERVPLASKAQVASMADGELLAVIAGHRARLQQRRYYLDADLSRRAAASSPASPWQQRGR